MVPVQASHHDFVLYVNDFESSVLFDTSVQKVEVSCQLFLRIQIKVD